MMSEPTFPVKGNILIVDDNRDDLRLLAAILSERGHMVRPALDGPSALAAASFEPPDLILLDVQMPRMDGYETCRRFKAHDRLRDIPVIFISARNEIPDKVIAFSVGGVDYVNKPFQAEEIIARIEIQLRLYAMQHRLEGQNRLLQQEIAERTRIEAELQQHYDHLEEMVEARTAELKLINAQLQQEIAERQRVEEALSLTRFTIDRAADALYWIDAEARFVDVNQAACRMLGYSREELLTMTVFEVDAEFSHDRWQHAWQQLKQNGALTLESTHKTRDGRLFPVELIANFIRFGDRELDCAFVRDITERKRIENQLDQSLQETRARFALSQDLAVTENEEEVLDVLIRHAGLYAEAYVSIFIFEHEGGECAAIARRQASFQNGIEPDSSLDARLSTSHQCIINSIASGQIFVADELMADERLDSSIRDLARTSGIASAAAFPLITGNEWLGYILVFARPAGYFDQDKQQLYLMLAEQGATTLRAARLRATIRTSQQRLSLLVEQSPLAVIEWDTAMRVLAWNPAAARIFGYTREEALGRHAAELILPVTAWDQADESWQSLRAHHDNHHTINDNITRDGRRITCEWYNAPLIGPEQNILSIVSLVQDITERKRVEEARRAQEKAEAANQAKSSFLTYMSHELRTPLNSILGYTHILKHRLKDTDVINNLTTIQQSGEHLLTMINDILDLAKIEAGKVELTAGKTHLPSLLHGIIGIIRSRAEAKDLRLTYEIPTNLPTMVQVDERRLSQILLNLLGNAVKFTDRGIINLTVEVLDQAAPDHERGEVRLRFIVSDTGVGIAPDQIERIFQPFEQGRVTGRHSEGTGLGLAISRQIVALIGGSLHVQSRLGRGSRFWFDVTLPIAANDPVTIGVRLQEITGYSGPQRKVLVVDDQADNRIILQKLLEPLGFIVQIVGNGTEAINQALAWQPDVILMDIVMPGMSGLSATQELRARGQQVIIIAVSASAMESDVQQTLQAGCNAFVSKPIDVDALLTLLADLLMLEWIYTKAASYQHENKQADRCQRTTMALPPRPELEALYHLAQRGNLVAIDSHVRNLAAHNPHYAAFAIQISELSRAYEDKQVRLLLKEYLEMVA